MVAKSEEQPVLLAEVKSILRHNESVHLSGSIDGSPTVILAFVDKTTDRIKGQIYNPKDLGTNREKFTEEPDISTLNLSKMAVRKTVEGKLEIA